MNKLLCFLLLISSTIFGQNNTSYSLLDAQDFALKNHLSIKNSELAIQKSQELKKEYLAIGLPQVSANSGFNNFLNLPVQVVSAKFLNPNANEGEVVSFKGGTDYSLLGNVHDCFKKVFSIIYSQYLNNLPIFRH
jgi:hypothetical protein